MSARSMATRDRGYVELSDNSNSTFSLLVDDGDDIACVELSREQLAQLQRFCEDAWFERREATPLQDAGDRSPITRRGDRQA